MKTKVAFTLIELLVVIAIIILLAGLLMPALSSARNAAKEGKARVQINQIATALRAYYNEYAAWPAPSTATNGRAWAVILTGGTWVDSLGTNNPRKIVFLEFKSSETNQFGIADPWGATAPSATGVYFFGFDTDYNNTIDLAGGPAADYGSNTNSTFIIWSEGNPKKSPRTILGSWK